jgi:glycosyltransferase involved in cell wall biosynthesis
MHTSDWFSKKRLTEFFEKSWMLKRYKRCNNQFIAISRNTSNFFKSALPKELQNITIMHNAIDFQKFASNTIRHPKNRLISMVTIGSLVDKKNQIFLCDVVNELNILGYRAHLEILGDGKNKKQIEEKIKALNLEGQMFLRGAVSNVEEYLKKSSFYVHPAIYEPFGLVLLEAMAASNVVIALNGKGNLDIHQEGINGFIIDPPNPKEFALKLIELSENKKLFEYVAKGGHEFAKQYDIHIYCERLIEYYFKRMELKNKLAINI